MLMCFTNHDELLFISLLLQGPKPLFDFLTWKTIPYCLKIVPQFKLWFNASSRELYVKCNFCLCARVLSLLVDPCWVHVTQFAKAIFVDEPVAGLSVQPVWSPPEALVGAKDWWLQSIGDRYGGGRWQKLIPCSQAHSVFEHFGPWDITKYCGAREQCTWWKSYHTWYQDKPYYCSTLPPQKDPVLDNLPVVNRPYPAFLRRSHTSLNMRSRSPKWTTQLFKSTVLVPHKNNKARFSFLRGHSPTPQSMFVVWDQSPEQFAPPCWGVGQSQVLVWVKSPSPRPPHVTEQVSLVQLQKPPSTNKQEKHIVSNFLFGTPNLSLEHGVISHEVTLSESPEQSSPPFCGTGLVHDLLSLRKPGPHGSEHAVEGIHTVQPPSTNTRRNKQ